MSLSSTTPSMAAAIGFPGGVPIFPSTDNLESSSIKVVVGSWRRINPATSTSSDFTVDVATYAPKTPFVTRVQLVDVDIPNTQQLIEAAWSRLYYQQGVPISLSCRSLDITVDSNAVSIVLPLPIDRIRMTIPLPDGVTRMFTTHRAPWPITAIADTWRQFSNHSHHYSSQYYGLRVFGVQGFENGFLLTRENVCAPDTGAMAFDIVSYAFSEALDKSAGNALYLCAAPIPGPTFLAAILTKVAPTAVTMAVPISEPERCPSGLGLVSGGGGGGEPTTAVWQFQFQYSTSEDRFSLYTRLPRQVEEVVISGQLAEYMGFGSYFPLEVGSYPDLRSLKTTAQNSRTHPRDAYACLESDSPRTECEIARNLQAAFGTYTWPGFRFHLLFPGEAALLIAVPGGRMTLRQLADTVQDITLPLCGVYVAFTATDSGDKSGLRFEHPTRIYALDFSEATTGLGFKPSRIGYERRTFPPARLHFPIRAAVHIPQLADCLPPACDIWVSYNEETRHILLQSVPFSAFAAVLSGTAVSNIFRVDTSTTSSFRHGLQVSARLVIASAAVTPQHIQFAGIVVTILSLSAFEVLLVRVSSGDGDGDGDSDSDDLDVLDVLADGGHVMVVPQDRWPIDLYLQTVSTREKAIFPQMLGFQALTYESWCDLLSPGTLDIRQDPYLLLCLSFQAEDATAQCGNVYYPFETTSQLIFAKILKSTCAYKSDYDRGFFHEFRGAGIHLGYIRVRVLNSDGTLYESHGHHASVCLKFDVKQSGVTLGGPSGVLQLPTSEHRQPAVTTFSNNRRI